MAEACIPLGPNAAVPSPWANQNNSENAGTANGLARVIPWSFIKGKCCSTYCVWRNNGRTEQVKNVQGEINIKSELYSMETPLTGKKEAQGRPISQSLLATTIALHRQFTQFLSVSGTIRGLYRGLIETSAVSGFTQCGHETGKRVLKKVTKIR